MRFWASVLTTLSVIPLWLRWGLDQSEQQIDKMQEAVFNSPGTQAPIPPPVLLATSALLSAHLLLGLTIFRLSFWRTLLSLLLSFAAGTGLFLIFLQRNE